MAGPGAAGPQPVEAARGVLRAEEDAQPAVGDLAGELEVARADRSQVERDALADGVHRQLQRLARPSGQRQRPVLPRVCQAPTAQRQLHHLDVLPGATQRVVEAHAVPPLGDLRSRDAEPEPETPARQRIQRRGRHRGGGRRARRDLHDGAAHVDALRERRDVSEDRGAVRAVGLRRPDHRVAEPVGLLGQRDVGGVLAGAPVAEVEAQAHAASLSAAAGRAG